MTIPFAPPSEDFMRASDLEPAIAALSAKAHPRPSRSRSIGALAAFAALTGIAAIAGAATTTKRRNKLWYRFLRKPRGTPPDRAFGVVWPLLYSASVASAWRIWKAPPSKARSTALALWGAQLLTNAAWTPLFFGAHRPRAALADLGLLELSLLAYTNTARTIDRGAARLMLPYIGWVGFAGYLNAGVIAKNR